MRIIIGKTIVVKYVKDVYIIKKYIYMASTFEHSLEAA